jgi:outer membrane immunogenic protein
MSDTSVFRCIGGAVVGKDHVCCVVALLVFGAFGVAGAAADEMTVAPAAFITAPTGPLHWTGFYVGANGGYGWDSSAVTYSPNDAASQAGTCGGVGRGKCIPDATFQMRGGLAGGQAGFNWQINSMWVTGVEADYQWANITAQGVSSFHLGNVGSANTATNMIANEAVKSFGTVRVRMGVEPANPFLFYGTAGLAFGQVSETFSTQSAGSGTLASGGFSYSCLAGASCFGGTSSKTLVGWTVGGGGEYALTSNLTFKAEVLFVDLGVPRATVVAQNTVAGTSPASFTATFLPAGFLVARGGLNLKF